MTKRTSPPDEVPPSLTKQQAQQALRVMKEKGEAILAQRPVQEAASDTWTDSTIEYLKRSFGSRSNHITTFIGQIQVQVSGFGHELDERYLERDRVERLRQRIAVLGSLIDQLDIDIRLEAPTSHPVTVSQPDFWPALHAEVVKTAKARFDGGHYADAVESAFKEFNARVKELVRKKTGKELDGADLMHTAFSPKTPIVVLADLSTESGRNEQQGYMEIAAGAMTGIRNPNAHQNITIPPERAIHLLFVASLLFHKLDERP